jgi:hydroxymethylpyrimidine pyrophosphatase-like HAD family hydrolase
MTIHSTPAPRPGLAPVDILAGTLHRRFEAIVFDWDGTAVPDRAADASAVRRLVERLCGAGLEVVVVSGTHVGNVDGQLAARPTGPGPLHLCLNRGSEVWRVDREGPHLLWRRAASPGEEAALTRSARRTVRILAERGLRAEIVTSRLNRRKIDVIPEPEWIDPPKARIDELLEAVERRLAGCGLTGLPEVVELALEAARAEGLAEARVTSDAKHVEIGLTDKADSARWIARHLWQRGVAPPQVLVVGDELGPLGGLPGSDSLMMVPEMGSATVVSVGVEPNGVPPGVLALGGGPEAFLALLEDQLRRRRHGGLPEPALDPSWSLTVEGFDPGTERRTAALLTLADGEVGTTGGPAARHPYAQTEVLVNGTFDGRGLESRLQPCPVWTSVARDLTEDDVLTRTLDLRIGVLHEQVAGPAGTVRSARFSSMARPGTVVSRSAGALEDGSDPLVPPAGDVRVRLGRRGVAQWMRVDSADGSVTAAASEVGRGGGSARTLDRVGAYVAGREGVSPVQAALRAAGRGREEGFDRLLAAHRAAWAARWEDADIQIEGDPELQRAVRFALFHLMASVGDTGEACVGARGLSGPSYAGHVFWDSDVFVLPFLAATHPAAARAMLEYRIRRVPAALAAARDLGRAGARFPWESALSGFDVTPTSARDRAGAVLPIRTGLLEEHIVADVAWAASAYADWTGDVEFLAGAGRPLIVETARYWASRIRLDRKGQAHLYGVIGPDEYHESVDDNAFTNVMARWNLRRALRLETEIPGGSGAGAEERRRWAELAGALVDNFDPATKLYEQFAGYRKLEPLVIRDLAPSRPIAAEALLGRDRLRGSQVIKQADVLMLHHMIPEEVAPASLEPNLAFYEPRTAHGSSLSPAIHASLLARSDRLEEAVGWLRLAARLDLDDLTGSTAGGLHLATMGGVWQALVSGFAGIRPAGRSLRIDPHLSRQWGGLEIGLRFRGLPVRVRVEADRVVVEGEGPLWVALGSGRPRRAGPGASAYRREGDAWIRETSRPS